MGGKLRLHYDLCMLHSKVRVIRSMLLHLFFLELAKETLERLRNAAQQPYIPEAIVTPGTYRVRRTRAPQYPMEYKRQYAPRMTRITPCGKCLRVSDLTHLSLFAISRELSTNFNTSRSNKRNQYILEFKLKSGMLRMFLIMFLGSEVCGHLTVRADLELGFLPLPSAVLAALSSAHKFVFSDFYLCLRFASIFLSRCPTFRREDEENLPCK